MKQKLNIENKKHLQVKLKPFMQFLIEILIII